MAGSDWCERQRHRFFARIGNHGPNKANLGDSSFRFLRRFLWRTELTRCGTERAFLEVNRGLTNHGQKIEQFCSEIDGVESVDIPTAHAPVGRES